MIKKHTDYTYEHEENIFPLPFDPERDPEHIFISEDKTRAVLAFLVQDESPQDPIEESDNGTFVQFNRDYESRPTAEDFKRIIRAAKGRLVTVDRYGEVYKEGEVLTAKDTRGKDCKSDKLIEEIDGYYLVPDDVTDVLEYAKGSISEYSSFCTGDVYGVIVWEYKRESTADTWSEPNRDQEVWGYYGYKYAGEELKREFDSIVSAANES